MNTEARTAKIRDLNDHFRTTGRGGRIMMTRGIQSLGENSIKEIIRKIRAFDTFTKDNDPYGEHDFGKISTGGVSAFFKIDYYDRSMQFASSDPSDPKQTERVMTIMLCDEY